MKELKDMDLNEIIDWATGELIVSIGQGKMKEKVALIIMSILNMQNNKFNQKFNKKRFKHV
jgi:hypothetical protein